MTTGRRQLGPPLLALLVFVSLWQLATVYLDISPVVLPSPAAIIRVLAEDLVEILKHTGVTMIEALLGFIIGGLVAYGSAMAFVLFPRVKTALYPYAIALKSTPLIAVAPILIVWLGNDMLSKVVMAAMVSFFPVLVAAVDGLTSVPRETIDLFRSLSASPTQIMLALRMPYSLPRLFTGLKVGSSLSVVGAIIGEFTGAKAGIGHYIKTASYYLETANMFAGVFAIGLAGVLFFALLAALERKILFWIPVSQMEDE